MTFPISRVTTWNSNDTLTASDLNGEFNNIINNLKSDNIDDSSANAAAMQATADPYPAASESLATNLLGEIQRIRYMLKQFSGEAQWYVDPDASLQGAMEDNTYCVFYQDTAPTNWTIQDTLDDKLLFVTKGSAAGGETGGGDHSTGTWTQPNHLHTTGDHTLTTNEMPSHSHGVAVFGAGGSTTIINVGLATNTSINQTSVSTGGGAAHNHGNTGNGATANTWRPDSYCVIIAQRA